MLIKLILELHEGAGCSIMVILQLTNSILNLAS